MKPVTMFQAEDGQRFDTESECVAHDNLLIAIKESMLPLGDEPSLRSYQYLQHDAESCLQAKRSVLAIARRTLDTSHWPAFSQPDDSIYPCSIVGRILADAQPTIYSKGWHRLMCINWENFREYEQPYFALHANEATELVSR